VVVVAVVWITFAISLAFLPTSFLGELGEELEELLAAEGIVFMLAFTLAE
jgi:hypothetical protein